MSYRSIEQALLSEIGVDSSVQSRLNSRGHNLPCFRPYKLLPLSKKIGPLLSLGVKFFAILWLFFLPIYFFLVCSRHLVSFMGRKRNNHPLESGDNLFLVLSSRATQLSKNPGLADNNFSYYIVPWIKASLPPTRCIHLYDTLTVHSFFLAYVRATLYSYRFLLKHINSLEDTLQVYAVYNLVLVMESLNAMKPLPLEIFWVNHYDRWSILFDGLWPGHDVEKSLVQHGIEEANFVPAIQLTSLNNFYYFGEMGLEWFKDSLIKNRECEYHPLVSELTLTEVPTKTGQKSILVMGQPDEPEKEMSIIEGLCQSGHNLKIILKPHPLYQASIYTGIENFPVDVVTDRNYFPKVDIGINYYSTLGVEYESCGIPVIWHYNLDVQTTIDKTLQKLQLPPISAAQ